MSGKAVYKATPQLFIMAYQYTRIRCIKNYLLIGILLAFTPEQGSTDNVPTLESSHVELLCSEQGHVKYKLFAEKAIFYENGDKNYPEGIHITFYEADQTISALGSASSVYFSAESMIYELRGNVELKRLKDALQFNTEMLYWNPETETLYTDTLIRIETKEESLTGEGLLAKQDLSYYTITKPKGFVQIQSVK